MLYIRNRIKKERKKPVDGELIIFKIKKDDIRYFDSDSVSVVANIARRPSSFAMPKTEDNECFKDDDIDAFNDTSEIQYLLHEIKREKPHFLNLIVPSHLEKVFCIKPKLNNPRIIRQNGAFLLFGITQNKKTPAQLDSISVIRMKVNGSKKNNILEHLADLGITEGTLLPEIDKLKLEYLS